MSEKIQACDKCPFRDSQDTNFETMCDLAETIEYRASRTFDENNFETLEYDVQQDLISRRLLEDDVVDILIQEEVTRLDHFVTRYSGNWFKRNFSPYHHPTKRSTRTESEKAEKIRILDESEKRQIAICASRYAISISKIIRIDNI